MNRPVGKSGNLRYRLQRIGSCYKLEENATGLGGRMVHAWKKDKQNR
jgi:hypothetical protein